MLKGYNGIDEDTGFVDSLKIGWNIHKTPGVFIAHGKYMCTRESWLGTAYMVTAEVAAVALVTSTWYMWPRIVSSVPFMEKASNGIGAVTGPVGNALSRMYLVAAAHPFVAIASLVAFGLAIHSLTYIMNKVEPNKSFKVENHDLKVENQALKKDQKELSNALSILYNSGSIQENDAGGYECVTGKNVNEDISTLLCNPTVHKYCSKVHSGNSAA